MARRDWQARLRKRFEGRLEALAGALQDGYERVPAESPRSQFAENHGRANGAIFLWRRRQIARGLCCAEGERLVCPSWSFGGLRDVRHAEPAQSKTIVFHGLDGAL